MHVNNLENYSILPCITITVTRYSEPDSLLLQTLVSLANQKKIKADILMLDQQESSMVRKFCDVKSSSDITFHYKIIPAKSLSFARNEAIRMCKTDLLLFIDSDAIAEPDWAYHINRVMVRESAAIAGGKIIPKWHKKTGFLHRSNFVLDQYSMLNLGGDSKPVRKVIGAGFAINIKLLKNLAHFDENLGRQKGRLIGGEETHLCANTIKAGLKIFYVGTAIVHHQVFAERIKLGWLFKRMYYGGFSKAIRGGLPEPTNTGQKLAFWDYIALLILSPFYIIGYYSALYLTKEFDDSIPKRNESLKI